MENSRSLIEVTEDKALVNDVSTAKTVLQNINWNFYEKSAFFPNELHPFNPRAHHWYPATFIPEIPFTLVEALTPQRATVWDPFSGIGTTFFQAISLSRYAVATEICSVAVEYMKSLFLLFDPKLDLAKAQTAIEKGISDFVPGKTYSDSVPNNILIERLRPWFTRKTLNELCFLFSQRENCQDELRAIYTIGISSLLKTASNQDRG